MNDNVNMINVVSDASNVNNTNNVNNPSDVSNHANGANEAGKGKHILAEFWHCQCEPDLLTATPPLLMLLTDALHNVGLTLVGQAVHDFNDDKTDVKDNTMTDKSAIVNASVTQSNAVEVLIAEQASGVTLSLLLAESHLCIHTWGEYQTVTLDIYVCNVGCDNSEKAEALYTTCLDLFQPKAHNVNRLIRWHRPSLLPINKNL